MRAFFLILFALFAASLQTASAVVAVNQFTIPNKGYSLSGQINAVPEAKTIAIFFHGSGVLDRWETMPANITLDGKEGPIFKPISEELNKSGISTCVFDKRAFNEKGTDKYPELLKTLNFELIKADANAVLAYVEGLHKYNKIILIGHSEGTVVASELLFDHQGDKRIAGLILLGVLADNLKLSLHHQLTDIVAKNTFQMLGKNREYKIYPKDVPEQMKPGLPFEKIDSERYGYITYKDLLKVLEKQSSQFFQAIETASTDTLIMNKPVQWYRDLFRRKTLLEQAGEFTRPILIVHGELDQNISYAKNAFILNTKLKTLGKDSTLRSFPKYGHALSPEKNGLPTLGPIQSDAVKAVVEWAIKYK